MPTHPLASRITALTFDVFGTVVDWRGTIQREGAELNGLRGLAVDWAAVADSWRRLYRPTMDRVLRGELAWTSFDDLQRLMLDQVLDEAGISGLADEDRAELTGVWGRMTPWPDVVPGLTRMKRRFVVSTLSNGSVRQLLGNARHAGLPWDLILSTEMFQAYKPDPRVYEGARAWLQCSPDAMLMVAAHLYDLRAARALGWHTAFVARPGEWGPNGTAEQPEAGEFDLVAQDLEDVADQLGC